MPASIYQPFYLILITILTFVIMKKYATWGYTRFIRHNYSNVSSSFVLTFFLILFIGLRPLDGRYFVDMTGYNMVYYWNHYNARFYLNWNSENFIFDNLFSWMGAMKFDIDWFFLLIAAIYFFCIFISCRKIFPRDTYLALVVYLAAFSTFSFGTNGIKAGAAASIYLVALGYYCQNNKIMAVFFLWLSLGFHHSMLAPIVAFVIAHFYKNPKTYLYGWFFCLLLAALHITFFMRFFSGYTDEHGAEYLQETTQNSKQFVSGFRPDFYLYSAIPIFIGYYLIVKKKIKSKFYHFLWCTYTLTNCVFLLCTYGTFINRIAYLSWLMLPFVLLYPFINIIWSNLQKQYLKYVVYGHLGFTLLMYFYYIFIR